MLLFLIYVKLTIVLEYLQRLQDKSLPYRIYLHNVLPLSLSIIILLPFVPLRLRLRHSTNICRVLLPSLIYSSSHDFINALHLHNNVYIGQVVVVCETGLLGLVIY